MDLQSLQFLLSDAGDVLIAEASSLQGSFLKNVTTLRKSYSPELSSAVLELLELRKRAAKKFSRASEMFFTREALEQSTGESVSFHHAERFQPGSRVLDLACGIGGDAISLARRCRVTAVDIDPVRIAMAERNLSVYGLSHKVEFICADATAIDLDADAVFIDPSRRSEGRRTVSLKEMSPDISFILSLQERIPNCAVKLSPASDDAELDSLDAEIEFISDCGECKEAVAWFGGLKTCKKRATILPANASLISDDSEPSAVIAPCRYLYEPDPAIIRAHLIDQVAREIGGGKLDEHIAYLTSENLLQTSLADAYEILESLPFNIKVVKTRLREMGAGRVVVKKRGVPFDPIEVQRKLRLPGDKEFVLVLTRIRDKSWSLICLPSRNTEDEGRI